MILDTNALSAYADEDKRFEPVLRSADRCALPVIVLGEYRYGISLSKYRDEYARWLGEQLKLMEVLAVDPVTVIHFADIKCELKKTGTPIPGNDVWIAALARQHKLPVASRDQHFDFVPRIKRIGW